MYYVYVHRKATTGEIFYVGKGKGRRAWTNYDRSSFWWKVYNKHGRTVEIVESDLQEWYALELEQTLITGYGRVDNDTGCLVNHTDGGTGIRNFKHSPKFIAQVSERASGLNNVKADRGVYEFINVHTLEEFVGTRFDLEKKIGKRISDLFKGHVLINEWTLLSNFKNGKVTRVDTKWYSFINNSTGEMFTGTRRYFKKHTGVCSKPLFDKNLRYKQTKGWSLLP